MEQEVDGVVLAVGEDTNALLVSDGRRIKDVRTALEAQGLYNTTYRIAKLSSGSFALPLSRSGVQHFSELIGSQNRFPQTFEGCVLTSVEFLPSKRELAKAHCDHQLLLKAVEQFLSQFSLSCSDRDALLAELPRSWERHGDLVLLPGTAFSGEKWSKVCNSTKQDIATMSTSIDSSSQGGTIHIKQTFWKMVASALKCQRVAINNRVECNGFRSSTATLVLGDSGWVEHTDNAIKYVFDVTKVMFSSGNVTEKLRVASFKCDGETVLDLYAGIGYFTLAYLVHAKAQLVHACEWNGDAVEALERGLLRNGVREKCIVHFGDNRELRMRDFADRVNLGLIPSSEEGWPTACAALKTLTGGWLHIHGNVATHVRSEVTCPAVGGIEGEEDKSHGRAESNPWSMKEKKSDEQDSSCQQVGRIMPIHGRSKKDVWEAWSSYVAGRITRLLDKENPLRERGKCWKVRVREVFHVKSYAPHVDHLVADVECRPV